MDYEMKIMDARISGREDGEKVGEKRGKEIGEKIGKEAERRAGIKRLIIAMMEISTDNRIIFNAAKKQYGEYFSDGELKQFIAEAKNDSLQEA